MSDIFWWSLVAGFFNGLLLRIRDFIMEREARASEPLYA